MAGCQKGAKHGGGGNGVYQLGMCSQKHCTLKVMKQPPHALDGSACAFEFYALCMDLWTPTPFTSSTCLYEGGVCLEGRLCVIQGVPEVPQQQADVRTVSIQLGYQRGVAALQVQALSVLVYRLPQVKLLLLLHAGFQGPVALLLRVQKDGLGRAGVQ